MENFLIVSVGAVLGANLRYWFSVWAGQKFGSGFPFGTLIINVIGSFLIGFFMTLATEELMLDPRWRLFFAVGFLGAFTTFSTFTYESLNLFMGGEWIHGLLNLLGSLFLGMIAVGLGMWLGKLL